MHLFKESGEVVPVQVVEALHVEELKSNHGGEVLLLLKLSFDLLSLHMEVDLHFNEVSESLLNFGR